MKRLKSTAIALALAALFGLALTGVTSPTAQAQRQNGYWVRLARNASVRWSPGGATVVRNGRAVELRAGQWFHIDPGVGNKSWGLGYCCPDGGRGCRQHESVPGYILRSALSGQTASNGQRQSEAEVPAANPIPVSFPAGDAGTYMQAFFVAPSVGTTAAVFRGQERRICAREAWFRDDRLNRIGILRQGDRIIVDRYTDGARWEDGKHRWAIGRGVGRGITRGHEYGRVLADALCQ